MTTIAAFIFYSAAFLCGALILLSIAESDRLLALFKPKSKHAQSNAWGVYDGVAAEDIVGQVEVKPLPGKQKFIAGSGTYAAGRGVKMSGQG